MADQTLADLKAAQDKEYGTYVALGPIDHDGVRAYNTGDPVPVSNVKQYGYLEAGLVERTTTKAAKAVTTDTPEKV